mgnify:CR=1 FL=1
MALRNIPTREMVALTRTMVDPTHADHQILMARPMLASCMPELTAAHTDVVRVHRTVDIERSHQEIVDEQVVADGGHDALEQGETLTLTGLRAALEQGHDVTARAGEREIRLEHDLSGRQVDVLLRGGLINYMKERL